MLITMDSFIEDFNPHVDKESNLKRYTLEEISQYGETKVWSMLYNDGTIREDNVIVNGISEDAHGFLITDIPWNKDIKVIYEPILTVNSAYCVALKFIEDYFGINTNVTTSEDFYQTLAFHQELTDRLYAESSN